MSKKKKPTKADKYHTIETRKLIKKLLKEEKSIPHIAALLGFPRDAVQMIVDRWELEENLIVPRLVGVG